MLLISFFSYLIYNMIAVIDAQHLTFQPAVVIKIKEIQVFYRVILVLIQFLEEGLNKSCNMLLPFNCSQHSEIT